MKSISQTIILDLHDKLEQYNNNYSCNLTFLSLVNYHECLNDRNELANSVFFYEFS